MTWFKPLACVLAAIGIFVSGYKYAASIYQAEIAEIEKNHALALAEKTAELRVNERKQMEAVITAWEEYEKTKAELTESRATAGDLRLELERVRVQSDRYRKRLSQASASACKHFAVRLERCVGLLEEGSGLAAEGAELSQRVAGKHDALARVHQ